MTAPANRDERNGSARELVVVHVTDTINPTLAGRGDVSYQSPPLPREEAQTLVRLLLGRGEEPPIDERGGPARSPADDAASRSGRARP
jgi:hypothetical protein